MYLCLNLSHVQENLDSNPLSPGLFLMIYSFEVS